MAEKKTKETVPEVKETVSEETHVKTVGEIKQENAEKYAKKTTEKKKGKPRGGNNWLKPENQLNVEEGDNTKYLSLNMELMNMPSIDLNDVDQVQQRLNDYFALYAKYDMKPTVAGMAIALNGRSRKWLWAVVNDAPTGGTGYTTNLPKSVTDVIKKAHFLMENLWENYMQNGKINPVSGIFLGKNNYGYQDKTEYVLTPNAQNDSNYSPEEIRERYITADQQKKLSDNLEENFPENDEEN